MTLDGWKPHYLKLCAGLGRKPTALQGRVYFDVLGEFPESIIRDTVEAAIAKTWPPTHPHPADLREIATAIRRDRTVPASRCDVCGGDKFTITQCDGWHAVNGQAEPVNRQQLCKRDFPHARHEDAHPCRQCHPAARRAEPAA